MGTREGALRASRSRDPKMIKVWASKGGKASKKEDRTFYRDREIAREAGRRSQFLQKVRKAANK